jgi:RNA polymerase sigma factor (sigma-70 family)
MPRRKDKDLVLADFALFYREHAKGILVFHMRQVWDADAALDLTAETFAQSLAGRARFRGSSDADATAWLYGIARNLARRYHRSSRIEREGLTKLRITTPELEPGEWERIEQLAGLSDLASTVREHLAMLPLAQRRAVLLRVVSELPYPDVASRLGISEQAARTRVSRGLRALAGTVATQPAASAEGSSLEVAAIGGRTF